MTLKEIFDDEGEDSTELEKARLAALFKRYGYEETDIQKYLSRLFADVPAIKVIN